MLKLSDILKDYKKQKNLTLPQFAQKLDISEHMLDSYIYANRNARVKTLFKLLDKMGLELITVQKDLSSHIPTEGDSLPIGSQNGR